MDANPRRAPKNIWDGIFTLLGIPTAWYVFSFPIFELRKIGMPVDSFLASNASELSALLFFLGVSVVSLGPGCMLSNWIQWVIPFTRKQQDILNDRHGGAVFRRATKGLLKFSLATFVLIYPCSFLAGLNYYSIAPDGVFYRPWFAIHTIHYDWPQITGISTACYYGSKSPTGRYFIWFDDGRDIDLIAISTRDFFLNYSTLSRYLSAIPFNFYFDEQMSTSCPRSWRPYFQKRP
jgi:hypothetical protein